MAVVPFCGLGRACIKMGQVGLIQFIQVRSDPLDGRMQLPADASVTQVDATAVPSEDAFMACTPKCFRIDVPSEMMRGFAERDKLWLLWCISCDHSTIRLVEKSGLAAQLGASLQNFTN